MEMVLVIVVLGVITALTAPIFSQGLTASRLTAENLQTLEKLRYATERIARELRHINYNGASYDVSTMAANNLVFTKTDATNTSVTISSSGSNINLSYSTPAVSAVLTDEVLTFNFSYFDASGAATASTTDVAFVQVAVSLQNPTTGAVYAQRTRVALRDKS